MHRNPSTFSSQMDMNPPFPEHEHLNCPRCNSSNTKFCYYNNYNLSQPRHFCKNCRRYWTKGGTLRNIPIGGGIRKATKRSSNPNKRTSPTTQQPPLPPTPAAAPPLPQKQQPRVVYGYGNNLDLESNGGNLSSVLGSNHMGPFGNLLMDGLSSNLASKSDDDVLIRNPIADDFGSNFLVRLNGSNNPNAVREESSCWSREENGWPDLSIFTPGSSFH
ncbi:dof zinc finger protein DOF1.7 [Lactuca sativa]|uniref:Dof zinc finger protein n=1 Tax=Lactuca sativa TaxID=4236 RepID=A0A9R1X6R4_LACSA|nr:dof zinc finger protein DOF1.7 [Lactuca sativa]KAJ0202885.1 hypothetical protein LSAT_V11C500277100 [Lactuca sativa]